MVHIKKFLDKITHLESTKTKDVVIPLNDARGLRDEIAKLLSDYYALNESNGKKEEVIKVEIKGGGFK
jgi:hypothetical protein